MKHVCSPSADLSRSALWEGGNRAHELANQPNLEEYQLVWLELCDFMRMRACTGGFNDHLLQLRDVTIAAAANSSTSGQMSAPLKKISL